MQLHSSGRSFPALSYLHLSFCPTPFLYHSSSLHVLSLRQKPCVILSTLLPSSSFSPSLSLPTLALAFFLPAALSTRRDVCVYHTLISADTCSTPSLPPTLFTPSPHTHSRRWGESMKQNAPVNNLSLYSREPKWSLSSWQIHSNSKETGPLLAWIWYWEWKWYSD